MTSNRNQKANTSLLAQVLNLADLVEYQEGSVVSRTVIDQKSGTVTLFAFAQGQGLSEHVAPFNALVHILDGKARITISGKPFELDQGQAIIMPANQPHALEASDRFKMMLVMLRA